MKDTFFNDEHRRLQDKFGGRRVADALLERRVQNELSVPQIEFVEAASFFFIASGHMQTIDCSIKCGDPGFVKVIGPDRVAWPDYDGNLMFRTLGNINTSPPVSMLFVNFENPSQVNSPGQIGKLRLNGHAEVHKALDEVSFEGSKNVVLVKIEFVIPNCPRYLPDMTLVQKSKYTPRAGMNPPTPEWKTRNYIKPLLPGPEE